ncbi:hypothetical protein ACFQ48_05820 [Hymenobacter caeli]|uniref:GNAT superfamily N-acetyltransferase n=1 Tax=Hymenobacter caeli TaxID=2735894 RepID=A0ABX2FN61_9BACT|nr:hypothetical protein [Hymenobacter caeli]NRT18601.1 GNAT superfamily N-acetyltransferase [Hymenobacter caeli]
MTTLERLPYAGQLPASFFAIPAAIYAGLPYRPKENPGLTRELFALQAANHEIITYTDHAHLRLVGIFPHAGPDAYFGFWETTDDAPLNEAAFALLAADARQRGKATLAGPYHFNTFQRYRLRLTGRPSWQQFDREPVNPPYYPALLARAGFAPTLAFESRLLRAATVPEVYRQKNPVLENLGRIPYDFIPVTAASWDALEDELFALIQQIFGANPAYKPVSRAQFRQLYNREYAARLCPHSSVLFRDRHSGRLAALSLCQPNYAALQLPAGQAPVFTRDYARLPRKTLLAKTVGVHPDFRRQGLMSLLAAYAMQGFRDWYEEVLFCLMRADNFSLQFTAGMPVETAHYALFQKHLL